MVEHGTPARVGVAVRRALALLLATLGVAVAGLTNLYKNAGNASPNVRIGASTALPQGLLWNHGRTSELAVTLRYVDGTQLVFCLTHGDNLIEADGDTDYPTYWPLYENEVVLSWTWRSTRCSNAYYREGVVVR